MNCRHYHDKKCSGHHRLKMSGHEEFRKCYLIIKNISMEDNGNWRCLVRYYNIHYSTRF